MLKLSAHGDREILITRPFNAPRHLVFQAYTTPDLLKRWLGVFGDWSLDVCEVDLRVGGAYRYVWRKADKGIEMGMGGRFLEIDVPERLVCTELFDDAWYPGEAVVTATFEESGSGTLLSVLIRYDSTEIRDSVMRSPMESGIVKSYDKLEALLA